mgnify:CR=1 FL=1
MATLNFFKKIKMSIKPASGDRPNGARRIKNKGSRQISTLRMVSILLISILITIFLATATFVYQTVIFTIGQIQSIVVYQNVAIVDLIDFNTLNRVEEKWKEKLNTTLLPLIRNPFAPIVSSGAETETAE